MKKTKTIHLEIHPDKVAEFYFSLLRYKTSHQPNIQDLEQMANAIDFDYNSLLGTLELSEAQKQKIDDKLHSIHTYLLKSRKDSDDYFGVSKEDFERGTESRNKSRNCHIFLLLFIYWQHNPAWVK